MKGVVCSYSVLCWSKAIGAVKCRSSLPIAADPIPVLIALHYQRGGKCGAIGVTRVVQNRYIIAFFCSIRC